MKWSWKIANLAGIDVCIHATFLILVAWVALSYWQAEGTFLAVVGGVGFILALFFCVVLHEFGHALTARRFGIRTKNIILLPIGGIAQIEKMPDEPRQEMLIAIAGPLVSLAIAVALWLYIAASAGLGSTEVFSVSGGTFVQRLMFVNLLLAAFNLLPAFPMDGGRVFRAFLSLRMDRARATRIAAVVAQVIAIGLALVGLRYNLFLVFIAMFIWFGASMEAGMARVSSALSGLTAGEAMLTEYHAVLPDESLARAVGFTLSGSQKDFPVVAGGQVKGVLRQADLLRGLHDQGKLCRVDQVMNTDIASADIHETLETVFERIREVGGGLLVITDAGRVAGIIDGDNITELLKIQRALEEHANAMYR